MILVNGDCHLGWYHEDGTLEPISYGAMDIINSMIICNYVLTPIFMYDTIIVEYQLEYPE